MSLIRAAVLGANDGIVSKASLVIGVAAANSSHQTVLLTGIAGLVAGATSMASGALAMAVTAANGSNQFRYSSYFSP